MPHAQHTQSIPPAPVIDLLDEHDLARLFKRDVRTVRRWIKRGDILAPHLKVGRTRWWRREAILAHIAALETPSGKIAPKRTRTHRSTE